MAQTRTRTLTIAAAWLVCAVVQLRAHDIPVDVLVQMFVKPEGQRLTVLVRVPLAAMRDVNFPVHGQRFLNFPEPDELLRDSARLWILDPLAFEFDGADFYDGVAGGVKPGGFEVERDNRFGHSRERAS
jgi:hypothetical protein